MRRIGLIAAIVVAGALVALDRTTREEDGASAPPIPAMPAPSGRPAPPVPSPAPGPAATPSFPVPSAPEWPAVTGRLFDSETGAPIPDACVLLVTENVLDSGRLVATTDAAGDFSVVPESFAPAGYTFQKAGYIAERGIVAAPGERIELAPGRGATVRARVVDFRTREPVPAARVSIEDRERLATGFDGRFEFVAAPVTASIEIEAGGYECGRFREVSVPEADGTVEFALASEPWAFVRVTDAETGQPIETAHGMAFGWVAHDPSRGLYRVSVPGRGARFTIGAPGYARATLDIGSGQSESGDGALAVALGAAGTIEGRVLGATGVPLRHAWVHAESGDRRSDVALAGTDELGRYVLDGIPPGSVLRLRFGHWFHEDAFVDDVVLPGPARLTIPDVTLAAADMLEGVVRRDGDARPIAGAKVLMEHGAAVTSTWTEPDGTFALPRPGRAARVVVLAHGLAQKFVDVAGDEVGPVEIVLDEGSPIEGVVVDAGGRPSPGCRVKATYCFAGELSPEAYPARLEVETLTDRDGRFRVSGLVAGGWFDVAPRRGGRTGVLVSPPIEGAIRAGTAGLLYELGAPVPRSGLKGRVVSAAGGRLLDGVVVRSAATKEDDERSSFASLPSVAAGEFFVPIEPGRPVTVHVRAPGHSTRTLESVDVAVGEIRLETIALAASGSIAGVVSFADGSPGGGVEL